MADGLRPFSIDRVIESVERVKERLAKSTSALNAAGVRYAVAGGNAIALWVSRVDESAVRATQDVDILVDRDDFESVKKALESAGFIHRHVAAMEIFLDSAAAKARDAVHIIFADEKVRPLEPLSNPSVDDSEDGPQYRVLSLPALVQIKLTAFRDKDRTHLRDLIDVDLLDASWLDRVAPVLRERLQQLLDTPDG